MYSETTYTVTSSGLSNSDGSLIVVMLVAMLVVALISYAVGSYLLSRIFKKAGVNPGIAWVPVYNMWKMLEMGDQKGFWAILAFIPFVNFASIIFYYIAMYHIGRKFGKEDWFIALAILLPIVWIIILAFDKSQWNGGVSATVEGAVNPDMPPAYAPTIQVENSAYPASEPAVQPTYPTMSAPENNVEQQPAIDESVQPYVDNQPPVEPPTNTFN